MLYPALHLFGPVLDHLACGRLKEDSLLLGLVQGQLASTVHPPDVTQVSAATQILEQCSHCHRHLLMVILARISPEHQQIP